MAHSYAGMRRILRPYLRMVILDLPDQQLHHKSVVIIVFQSAALFLHIGFHQMHAYSVAALLRCKLAAVILLCNEGQILFVHPGAVVTIRIRMKVPPTSCTSSKDT